MTKQEITHFDKQFKEIKDTYEEVKRSYRIFNDDFMDAVMLAIEDKLDAHKKADKDIIVKIITEAMAEVIKNHDIRMSNWEKRIFDVEHKLIDLK